MKNNQNKVMTMIACLVLAAAFIAAAVILVTRPADNGEPVTIPAETETVTEEAAEAEDGKHRHQRRNPHRKQVLHHRGNRHAEDVLQFREDGRKRQPCENDHGAEEAYAIPLSRARCEDGPAEYGQIAPGQQARCDD